MKNFTILDCTLRDGGYVNEFCFGKHAIHNIIEQLGAAGVDIIECGFLRTGITDEDLSLFGKVSDIKRILPEKRKNTMYVAMIQYGKISNEEIVPYDGQSIDGIRLTFHEYEIDGAFVLGKQLMDKGYKVFMQPVGTVAYTDTALLELIGRINELKPYAFYLVDTLGTMYQKDIRRFFYLIDHNLNKKIVLGFHSHNNLQQAFTNAQEFMQMNTPRNIIIDATVQGLGRGAGNLCTELILQYINENLGYTYDMVPIFQIIDEYIEPLHMKYTWGYSAAYYLAATKGCHPNYATYLMNTQTLKAADINCILESIVHEKRHLYDEEYITQLYITYKSQKVNDASALQILIDEIAGRDVVIVAPGRNSAMLENAQIRMLEKSCYVLGVNFQPTNIQCDRIFFSNKKRLEFFVNEGRSGNLILSSNILQMRNDNSLIVNYSSYLTNDTVVADNAGLMCLNLLKKLRVKQVYLIGFDGFGENQIQNYIDDEFVLNVDVERRQKMNKATRDYIKNLRKTMMLDFLTASHYEPNER